LTKVDHSHEKTKVTKSSTFDLLLSPTADPIQQTTQLQNIKVILRLIVGLLQRQMEQVNSHTELKDLMESADPKEVDRMEEAFQAMANAMDGDDEEDEAKEEE
jgi:hypothetical protein